MDRIWFVLGLAVLPAIGNFGGGMLAEFMGVPRGRLNKALHGASGILIAVIAIELMPEALSKISGWTIGMACGLGGLAYIGIEAAVEKTLRRAESKQSSNLGMWMIYMVASIDLISDGLLIGTGSAVSTSMAIVLVLGQVLADVPEGYATPCQHEEQRDTKTAADSAVGVVCYPSRECGGNCLLFAPEPK